MVWRGNHPQNSTFKVVSMHRKDNSWEKSKSNLTLGLSRMGTKDKTNWREGICNKK